jgi:hypothetical protein
MTRAPLAIATVLVLGLAPGCVTSAALAKRDSVSLPLLIGAVAADLVVTSVAASQIQDYSTGGSIATGLAFTALDFAGGCLLGACSSLNP